MVVRRLPSCHSELHVVPARASSHQILSGVRGSATCSGADQPVQDPAHDQPRDGTEPPVEQGVLGLGVVARELLDPVVPGEDPEVDPVGARRGRTSPGRCPGWRPARSAARPRRGTARRSGTAARPPGRAPSAPGRRSCAPRPGVPDVPEASAPVSILVPSPRPTHPAPLAPVTDPRRWPCPAPARRRIAYRSCGRRCANMAANCGPLDLQPGVQVDLETRGRSTPSRPAARGRPHRRTAAAQATASS